MTYEEMINIPPYSLDADEKEKLLTDRLTKLTKLHQKIARSMHGCLGRSILI